MKTILDLSNIKAYRYFMEPENYCTVSFPVYISFKKILEYVESTVGNNELKTILTAVPFRNLPVRIGSAYSNRLTLSREQSC